MLVGTAETLDSLGTVEAAELMGLELSPKLYHPCTYGLLPTVDDGSTVHRFESRVV